jgi:hypothetical protein
VNRVAEEVPRHGAGKQASRRQAEAEGAASVGERMLCGVDAQHGGRLLKTRKREGGPKGMG